MDDVAQGAGFEQRDAMGVELGEGGASGHGESVHRGWHHVAAGSRACSDARAPLAAASASGKAVVDRGSV